MDQDLTNQRLVKHAQWRMEPAGGGIKPQAVSNDLAHLGTVLSVAKPA